MATPAKTPDHSEIGASSMYRWSKCPASVRFCRNVPKAPSSAYADEGTDAHALGAHCLEKDEEPLYYIGKTCMMGGRTFVPDREMAEAVSVYTSYVRGILEECPDATLQVERKFSLEEVHPGCFGTADAVIWDPIKKLLHVIDYKHGAGVYVAVENNPQLLYYGLGALLATALPAFTIRLTIVQPRCGSDAGPRSQDIDAIELQEFRAALKGFAVATENPDAHFHSGEHCNFCPGAGICPKLSQQTQDLARIKFVPDPGKPAVYDPLKIKEALDNREAVKAFLKALDQFAYAEMEAGRPIPGYKLVAKRAMRKWRSEGDVTLYLQEMGAKPEEIYEAPAVRSPSQIEKILGKSKELSEFMVQESSGNVLVPESDPRPAAAIVTARVAFQPGA